MSKEIYQGGRLVLSANDSTRTVTTYSPAGAVLNTRPYTVEEDAAADAAAVAETARTNRDTINGRAKSALAANDTFLAIASADLGQIRTQTRMLTRECSALIRLLLAELDTTAGT